MHKTAPMSRSGMRVRLGHASLPDMQSAVDQFLSQIVQSDIGVVFVFVSRIYNLRQIAELLRRRLGNITVIGCSTAGEIGPEGVENGSISGCSIHRDDFIFEADVLLNLADFDAVKAQKFAYRLRTQLREKVPNVPSESLFALMVIDGLSVREEGVTRAFYDGLGGIPLVGGSAGDGLVFKETFLIFNGIVHTDAAILLVGWSPFPFEVFQSQHFLSGDKRLVVTGAIPEERSVTEINGGMAAEEYGRAVGVPFDKLDPMIFAANPVVVQIGGTDFVRSIRNVNEDGSLTFFCAIDEGIVLRVASKQPMVETLSESVRQLHSKLGPISLTLVFDCILRRIELNRDGFGEEIARILNEAHTVGFSTYGEQFCGLHVNQTLTGIAFGERI